MSTAMIIVVIVASVIVVGFVTICALALMRRRELQRRFGAEYGRVVGESDNELKAEAGLKERERRVRLLPTCRSITQPSLTATERPRRSAGGSHQVQPPRTNCGWQ